MNATLTICDEDDLGYEFAARRRTAPLSNRLSQVAARQESGRERFADHARYQRKSAPTRVSGMHQRGKKRHVQ
jgi:hypothetical protein